jgi:hypothetical protein
MRKRLLGITMVASVGLLAGAAPDDSAPEVIVQFFIVERVNAPPELRFHIWPSWDIGRGEHTIDSFSVAGIVNPGAPQPKTGRKVAHDLLKQPFSLQIPPTPVCWRYRPFKLKVIPTDGLLAPFPSGVSTLPPIVPPPPYTTPFHPYNALYPYNDYDPHSYWAAKAPKEWMDRIVLPKSGYRPDIALTLDKKPAKVVVKIAAGGP